jgi:hypothetical protein
MVRAVALGSSNKVAVKSLDTFLKVFTRNPGPIINWVVEKASAVSTLATVGKTVSDKT